MELVQSHECAQIGIAENVVLTAYEHIRSVTGEDVVSEVVGIIVILTVLHLVVIIEPCKFIGKLIVVGIYNVVHTHNDSLAFFNKIIRPDC